MKINPQAPLPSQKGRMDADIPLRLAMVGLRYNLVQTARRAPVFSQWLMGQNFFCQGIDCLSSSNHAVTESFLPEVWTH
jgi:hypothetical protein